MTLKASNFPGNDIIFQSATLTYNMTSGTPVATPEPGSLLLLGSGLAGLAFTGRKKLRAKWLEAA
jgi:hypothetical protein